MFGKRLKNNPAPLSIEINLGFGVSMTRNVTTVWPADYIFVSPPPEFSHEHVVYPWPVEEGQTTQKEVRQHWVFPAVLTDIHTLMSDVDQHLSTLLDERENFYQFPFFNSPLKVLMMIYAYYEGLSEVNIPSTYTFQNQYLPFTLVKRESPASQRLKAPHPHPHRW